MTTAGRGDDDPAQLGAAEAARRIAAGRLTATALVEACLARIVPREGEVGAWAFLDPDLALAQARARDAAEPSGPLHGIPVGVKDIIDTVDMPTEYGSPVYPGIRPAWDAACVARLRAEGGIVMGKTVTTEFALRSPAGTRNPRDPAHTPGGSSSGSAAAVADFMVPLAFGTQTLGSVIRPAAYCGIVGYKPTWGSIDRAGVKPLSDRLDTIGVMTRTVEDAALLAGTLGDRPLPDLSGPGPAPRIGFCRTPQWPEADEATQRALEDAVPRLARAGAKIDELELSPEFEGLAHAAGVICEYDACRALSFERLTAPGRLSPWLADMLEHAETIERPTLEAAVTLAEGCRRRLDGLFREIDVILAPSAPGEAPEGLESTGSPIFCQMWTLLHVPAVTLPVFTGPRGLPIGAQVIGPRNGDARMLVAAEWIRRALE